MNKEIKELTKFEVFTLIKKGQQTLPKDLQTKKYYNVYWIDDTDTLNIRSMEFQKHDADFLIFKRKTNETIEEFKIDNSLEQGLLNPQYWFEAT